MYRGPKRRTSDRPWTAADHSDFEDELRRELATFRSELRGELDAIRGDLSRLSTRVSWLLGIVSAVALVAGPILATILGK